MENKNSWIAVMIGGDLEPHKVSDGYYGYGCPYFKTKKECETWIKDFNKKHPGEWLSRKSYLDCETPEESKIWENGAKAFAKRLTKELKSSKLSMVTPDKVIEMMEYLGVQP